MKKFAAILALLALTVIGLQAQSYNAVTITTSGILPLAGSTASNLTQTIDVRKQDYVTVVATLKANAADTSDVGFYFQRSLDGSTWVYPELVSVAAAGTTAVNLSTNLNTLGCGYMRIGYITNAHASASITNLTIKYGIKVLP